MVIISASIVGALAGRDYGITLKGSFKGYYKGLRGFSIGALTIRTRIGGAAAGGGVVSYVLEVKSRNSKIVLGTFYATVRG